jgi:vacuolar-type H+-ATPase subunit H
MADTLTNVDFAGAAEFLNQMQRFATLFDSVKGAINVVTSGQQLAAELDRAIAEKRATLADDNAKLIADATAAAGQLRDKIIAEANAKADSIAAEISAKVAEANAAVIAKQAELDTLTTAVSDAKQKLLALANG